MSKRSCTASDIEPLFEPIGTRDIISTPPETTRSSCPAMIAAAALKFVCIDEPHWRSTVVPATETGQPAVSAVLRPIFHACSPTWDTQPHCTSSTSAGSTEFRSTSASRTWAPSSSARMCESVPFLRPIGLRTASTIKASGTPRTLLRHSLSRYLRLPDVREIDRCAELDHELLAGGVGLADLGERVADVTADHDRPLVRLDDDDLMAARLARRRDDPDAWKDLLLTVVLDVVHAGEIDPLADREVV